MEKRRFESFEVFSCLEKKKLGKTPSSHIIHSLGGEYCWIVRDSEPLRLLKSPRSLSLYILISLIWLLDPPLVVLRFVKNIKTRTLLRTLKLFHFNTYWLHELLNISLTLSSSWIRVGGVFVVGKINIFWDITSIHFPLFCFFTPFNERINIQWGQYRGKRNKNIKLRNWYQSKKTHNMFT